MWHNHLTATHLPICPVPRFSEKGVHALQIDVQLGLCLLERSFGHFLCKP